MTRSSSTSVTASDRAGRSAPLFSCFALSAILLPIAALAQAPAAGEPAPVLPAPVPGAVIQTRTDSPLLKVLDQVGRQVRNFWEYVPGVTCIEALNQEKLGEKGKPLYQEKSTYDYLILLQASGDEISVDESRIEKSRKESKGKASLLMTNGFSILALIFHPMYQGRYEFTQLPDDVSGGQHLLRIGFRQLDKDRSPSVLVLRGRDYPLPWKGTAWIDPVTFAVLRIECGLESPMEDIGLLKLDAKVTYTPIRFSGTRTYWLPARAVIEAATRRQHWRNTHAFSDYRRFDVETEVKTTSAR